MNDLSTGGVIALIVLAVVVLGSVPAACWQVRRARYQDRVRDEIVRAAQPPAQTVWDDEAQQWVDLPAGVRPGPGQYTDADVAALDQLTLALAAPSFDPATDPQWAAARARLLNDLNNPMGDQT
jgi:hypothetical protein